MLSSDAAAPVDRPSLSKDYLAGNASEDGVPLRPRSFYSENAIDLRLATEVTRLYPGSREIALSDGQNIRYDRLLLATGAEPVRLWIPGGIRGTFILFVRLRIAVPSLHAHKRPGRQSFLVQALSRLRLRLLCVVAASKFMWWHQKSGPWNAFSVGKWDDSCNRSMKNTVSFSTSMKRPCQSQEIK